jgi:protocatechuate 3,4-dioxygenase beta subunit
MPRTIVAGLALALVAAAGAAACPGAATPALTEGPFYRPGSPERTVLRDASAPGRRLLLAGVVYDSGCRPVAGARLDFWQADARGSYDNRGFAYRGHQLTDAQGRYSLDTVVPGEYPGRTPHIHVKVSAAGGPAGSALTTQLFLPGEARNGSDSIFDPALVVDVREDPAPGGGLAATFDFRLPARPPGFPATR